MRQSHPAAKHLTIFIRKGLYFRPSKHRVCWYDAVVDQIKLLNIPGLPRSFAELRKLVVDSIPTLPQVQDYFV